MANMLGQHIGVISFDLSHRTRRLNKVKTVKHRSLYMKHF